MNRLWAFLMVRMTLVAVGWGLAAWMAMPVVFAAEPCCTITNIAEDGQVSVRETATGRTLAFQVNQPALLSSLRIGQEVWANFKTQQVSVDGVAPCCEIIPVSATAGAIPAGVRGPAAMFEPMGADPCCAITNVGNDGVVTARVGATGETMQFQVNQPALRSTLRIGQEVWANFKTQQVSVDGADVCCPIIPVSAGAGARPAGLATTAARVKPAYGEPCCQVVANPGLKGQMGRLVVNFPGEAKARGRKQWVVYQAGSTTELLSRYENFTGELLPGTYDLVVSGQRVNGVRIKAGHDTKLRLGTLRVQAAQDTPVAILDQEGKVGVKDHGNFEVGLPVGTFQVEVRGQRASVTIREGQVTKF